MENNKSRCVKKLDDAILAKAALFASVLITGNKGDVEVRFNMKLPLSNTLAIVSLESI